MSAYTYVLLAPGHSPQEIEPKFPEFIRKHRGQEAVRRWNFFLQPLTSIHLHSHLNYELGDNGDIKYVYIFSAIALFIIIIASINFMNLSTARSSKRAKEAGVRKVLGALTSSLFYLLSSEFIKWIVLSSLIAWPLAYTFMSQWLNNFAYRISLTPLIFIFSAVAALLIAVLTVSFQALKTSRSNPAESLRYE